MTKTDNEFEKLTLGCSGITDEVYVGITNKSGTKWLKKKVVTNDFLCCLLALYDNRKVDIINQSTGEKYLLTLKKVRSKCAAKTMKMK